MANPNADTRQQVAEFIAAKPGATARDIAKHFDISTQRVYQLTNALGLKFAITGKWVSKNGNRNGKEGADGGAANAG